MERERERELQNPKRRCLFNVTYPNTFRADLRAASVALGGNFPDLALGCRARASPEALVLYSQ